MSLPRPDIPSARESAVGPIRSRVGTGNRLRTLYDKILMSHNRKSLITGCCRMYYRFCASKLEGVFVSSANPRFLKSSLAIRFLDDEKKARKSSVQVATYRSIRHDRYDLAILRHSSSLTPLTFLIHERYLVMTALHSPGGARLINTKILSCWDSSNHHGPRGNYRVEA